MRRRTDAHVSQSSMSENKIIYVEGNLDQKIIRDFLEHNKIRDTRVTEINIAIDDSSLPVTERKIAKQKVIDIIRKCNEEGKQEKTLGIVDLDYDYFDNCLVSIPNLKYTDFNSMESYFINNRIINKILEDYNLSKLSVSDLGKWENNSLLFSSLFYYQISNIEAIPNNEKIKFKELSLDNPYVVNFDSCRINIKRLISTKTDCENIDIYVSKFYDFLKTINRNDIYQNTKLFLHGKYTFRFIVVILKRMHKAIKNLSYESIECFCKDKFILFDANNHQLFQNIMIFSAN